MTDAGAGLADWLESLAGRSPSPSGGSAAAIALSVAAALGSMVARYSANTIPDAAELERQTECARRRAFSLAAADEAAVDARFGDVSTANGRMEASEASNRAAAGDRRGHRAAPLDMARVPLDMARVPLDMVALAAELAPVLSRLAEAGNSRLRGDALVAIELLKASSAGAAALVRIDADLLPDDARGGLLSALSEEEARISSALDRTPPGTTRAP